MKLLKLTAPVLGVLALAGSSFGTVLTFTAVGQVTSISDPYNLLGTTVNINDPVTVTVSYETTDATTPSPFWGGVRYYFTAPSQPMITATVGSHSVTTSGTYAFLDSWDNTMSFYSGYTYWGGTATATGVNQLGASFFDPTSTFANGGLFPTSPLPGSLTNGGFTMQYVDDWMQHGAGAIVSGTLINPNAVPEPATLAAGSIR